MNEGPSHPVGSVVLPTAASRVERTGHHDAVRSSDSTDSLSPRQSLRTPVSRLRLSIELTGLLLLLLSLWCLAGDGWLLKRSLWMDEVHTWLIVTDPDAGHALQALADGVDFNPPAYYAAARLVHWLPGQLTEQRLRWLSIGLMLSAMIACYVLLRRQCSWRVTLASVLLVASSPVIVHQCTEIRFYAFWLAAVCWLAVLLDQPCQRFPKTCWVLCLTLTGVICTGHYFGIISVWLLLAPELIGRLPCVCTGSRSCWLQPKVSGGLLSGIVLTSVVAVAMCLPLLRGQRAALSQPTWITPPTFRTSAEFVQTTLRPEWLAVLGVAGLLLRPRRKQNAASIRCSSASSVSASTVAAGWPIEAGSQSSPGALVMASERQPGLLLMGLSLMPVVLVVLSWCLQPAMVTRYAIVAAVGLAPLYALLLTRLQGRWQTMFLVSIAAWCFISTREGARQWGRIEMGHRLLEAGIDRQPPGTVVVFEDRIVWMPLIHRRPDLAHRCRLLSFDDNQLPQASPLRSVQRDVGHKVASWYPQFRLMHLDTLQQLHAFIAVPYSGGTLHDLPYPRGYEQQALGSWGFACRRNAESNAARVNAGQIRPAERFFLTRPLCDLASIR